jgi:uncharacterized membrane protein/nitrite reductase/ring-hydroxylating ferredoxin subunit
MRARAHIKSHPIHPMLVAFPLGLWITGFIVDLIGVATDRPLYWSAGYVMIVAGAVFAALAAIPGLIDLFSVVPPNSSGRKRGLIHGILNTLTLLLFIYVAAHRGSASERPDSTSLLLSLLGVGTVLFSGWLGATLVYRNQIGVDHRYAGSGKWKERELPDWGRPVCNQSELGDGQMMLARVGSDRVVVGKCNEGIFAFSDHCTHKGGGLSDGALVGCVVQCPWHGSQFDIRNGRVVSGPAQRKIDSYDVEIRSGEVYIKVREGEQARESERKGTQKDKGESDSKKAA